MNKDIEDSEMLKYVVSSGRQKGHRSSLGNMYQVGNLFLKAS